MAKKQAQFRFDEDFLININKMAEEQGVTVSEIVRNALKLYKAIYDRTQDRAAKVLIEYCEDDKTEKCEIILPWLF